MGRNQDSYHETCCKSKTKPINSRLNNFVVDKWKFWHVKHTGDYERWGKHHQWPILTPARLQCKSLMNKKKHHLQQIISDVIINWNPYIDVHFLEQLDYFWLL